MIFVNIGWYIIGLIISSYIVFFIKQFFGYKLTEFEEGFDFAIMYLGLPYWIIKLVARTIFKVCYKKTRDAQLQAKKDEDIVNKGNVLIRSIRDNYNEVGNLNTRCIITRVKELKASPFTDLYLRAFDSYKDLVAVLLKCSDGEGHIDVNTFSELINLAINECGDVIEVAYREMNARFEAERVLNLNNKNADIEKDILNMVEKNKGFKEMYKNKEV